MHKFARVSRRYDASSDPRSVYTYIVSVQRSDLGMYALFHVDVRVDYVNDIRQSFLGWPDYSKQHHKVKWHMQHCNTSMSLYVIPMVSKLPIESQPPCEMLQTPKYCRVNQSLALFCIFLKIGSILVAFITSPLTFNFPLINSFCAFASPLTSFPKSASLSDMVTADFLPSGAVPLPAFPLSLRSMCQDSCAPFEFLRVKAKMAPPFLIASLRSDSSERAELMASKAAEEGKFAVVLC